MMHWLAEAEQKLRYNAPIADEEPLVLKQIEEHKVSQAVQIGTPC